MGRYFLESWNTGSVSAGADYNFNRSISKNYIDIVRIRVVPSVAGPSGYRLKLFKDAARTLSLFSTRDNKTGNFYYPTTLAGGEALEGQPLPYEDVDLTGQIHGQIHNFEAASRTYDVYIWYQENRFPLVFEGNANANIINLGAEQDVAGATFSITRVGKYLVTASAHIGLNATSASGRADVYLNVNGSNNSRFISCQKDTSGQNEIRTHSMQWIITISSQPQTVKLRAAKIGTPTQVDIWSVHTSLQAVWLGEA